MCSLTTITEKLLQSFFDLRFKYAIAEANNWTRTRVMLIQVTL